ncbi:hypothetical protein LXL04_011386 [Taraxacum kok-saghyz]
MLKNLCQTLKSLPRNPRSTISVFHFHTRKKTLLSNPAIDFILNEIADLPSSNTIKTPIQDTPKTAEQVDAETLSIENLHPWPEWVVLMQKLMKNGYLDVVSNPFRNGELIDGKACNQIRTACLNFARDRPDLMSYFTRGDIHAVAGSGCPSIDRKVVNSGKRLRAYIGIDEGNVCSSCDLRGKCERAYVKPREEEDGRTVDVMRFVLTYGLHHLNHSPDSEPYMNKRLEEAIRSLIGDMVKFSKTELDFDPSKCAPSVYRSDKNSCEYHERIENLGDNRNQAELKRGDWICIRCKFFNFAKNTKCLRCHTNPPKRQLNPGEWECNSCNYINFRRNMITDVDNNRAGNCLDVSPFITALHLQQPADVVCAYNFFGSITFRVVTRVWISSLGNLSLRVDISTSIFKLGRGSRNRESKEERRTMIKKKFVKVFPSSSFLKNLPISPMLITIAPGTASTSAQSSPDFTCNNPPTSFCTRTVSTPGSVWEVSPTVRSGCGHLG